VKSPDVVVIGGGIVGCAAVYFLARSGLRTLLVERDGITCGTSGSCMGHLMMMPGPDDVYHLTRRSITLWKQLYRDVGGFAMNECGCLWLAESAEDMHSKIAAFGDTGEVLTGAELTAREPVLAGDLSGAFFYPDDAIVMPMEAAGAMLAAAVAEGAEIWHHTEVRGLRRAADGSVRAVVTSAGEVETTAVVDAAGVEAPDITEMAGLPRTPIFPRRGDLAITMPGSQPVRHQLIEVGYLRTATGKVADPEDEAPDPGACALNVQPQANDTVLIGSSRQFSGFDRRSDPKLMRGMLSRATRFVPCLADLQVTRTWSGLLSYTRVKLPVIGPASDVPGLFMAAGHEGLGITLAMVTGELIAQAVRGEKTSLSLAPFSIDRFAEVVSDG